MQPTCRHVPPRNGSFSTTMVFRPSSPARMAATYPPGPLPIIAMSYFATRVSPFLQANFTTGAKGWAMMENANGIALWSAARTRELVIVTAAGTEEQLRSGAENGRRNHVADGLFCGWRPCGCFAWRGRPKANSISRRHRLSLERLLALHKLSQGASDRRTERFANREGKRWDIREREEEPPGTTGAALRKPEGPADNAPREFSD